MSDAEAQYAFEALERRRIARLCKCEYERRTWQAQVPQVHVTPARGSRCHGGQ